MKLSYIFSKKRFSYILGNGTFQKNILCFRGELSKLEKQKKTTLKFIFREINKTFLIPIVKPSYEKLDV